MTGRALTDDQKRAVMERVLAAWQRVPQLRFGQFISNARAWRLKTPFAADGLFYAEDEELAALCEQFADDVNGAKSP